MNQVSTSAKWCKHAALACFLVCIFFAHSVLIASAHVRMQHVSQVQFATKIGQAAQAVKCLNGSSSDHSNHNSHIYESDCCVFCQTSSADNSSIVINPLGKIIYSIKLEADFQERISWKVDSPAIPSSVGIISNWAAQAPPQL